MLKDRHVNWKYLLVLLVGAGMAAFAFYYVLFHPDPLTPHNLLPIQKKLAAHRLDKGKTPRLLLWLEGETVAFSVGAVHKTFRLEEFLDRESPGSMLNLTVSRSQYTKPRKVPIEPGLLLVDTYAVSSERGTYRTLEDSRKYEEFERKAALGLGFFMVLCCLVMVFVAFPAKSAYGRVEIPWPKVFYGYQPFWLRTDRLYLVRVTNDQIDAAYVGGQAMSPDPMTHPLMFAKKHLVETYVFGEGSGMSWRDVDPRNLQIFSHEVARVEFSPKQRMWVAPHPHAGTLYFHFGDGRRLEFILIGEQSAPAVITMLREAHFPVDGP